MLPFFLVVVIVVAIVWWATNRQGTSRNERLYLRRRGYAIDDGLAAGPPLDKDARLLDLIRSLGDVTPYSRQRAAEELSRMCVEGRKDGRMFAPLISALEDADASVRGAVALALGDLGDTRAVGALERALEEEDSPHVRASLARSLEKLR